MTLAKDAGALLFRLRVTGDTQTRKLWSTPSSTHEMCGSFDVCEPSSSEWPPRMSTHCVIQSLDLDWRLGFLLGIVESERIAPVSGDDSVFPTNCTYF